MSAASTLFTQRVVIGVGEVAVSNNPAVTLSTYALGSCVGIVAYDPAALVGGILHLMLPDSKISPAKASAQPAMFADTGLRQFFQELLAFGARPPRLRLFVAGGATVIAGNDPFRIGIRNAEATRGLLLLHGFTSAFSDTGGTTNRTLHLALASGELTLKTPHTDSRISLTAELLGDRISA